MVDVCTNSTVSMVAKTHMVVYGLAHCYDQGMPINLLAPAPRPRSIACWNLDTKRKRLASGQARLLLAAKPTPTKIQILMLLLELLTGWELGSRSSCCEKVQKFFLNSRWDMIRVGH